MQYYDKPARDHAADEGIKSLVNREMFQEDKPTWSEWLALPPGKEMRLFQLYSFYACQFGDWLYFKQGPISRA